ncbi:hypothetical protein CCHR01_17346 [Colletotrichum chrysophilum]|uniref:Uncharacterized protein n=1 Tax=Colletotrichum chrysophilum TaxID=1836956 RepID=A0AAD9A298_9PEZI|nr:hypothetical protein CCHR01_17346 [Colletotrichum chrysophilum]
MEDGIHLRDLAQGPGDKLDQREGATGQEPSCRTRKGGGDEDDDDDYDDAGGPPPLSWHEARPSSLLVECVSCVRAGEWPAGPLYFLVAPLPDSRASGMAIARFWALDASIVGMEDAWNIRKGFVWWITVAWLTGRCQMVRPTEEQGPGLREEGTGTVGARPEPWKALGGGACRWAGSGSGSGGLAWDGGLSSCSKKAPASSLWGLPSIGEWASAGYRSCHRSPACRAFPLERYKRQEAGIFLCSCQATDHRAAANGNANAVTSHGLETVEVQGVSTAPTPTPTTASAQGRGARKRKSFLVLSLGTLDFPLCQDFHPAPSRLRLS